VYLYFFNNSSGATTAIACSKSDVERFVTRHARESQKRNIDEEASKSDSNVFELNMSVDAFGGDRDAQLRSEGVEWLIDTLKV
jgi:hypothetical protein